MDKELIRKLSKAGVSSDVILALMLDDDDKKPAEVSEQKPEVKPEEKKPEEQPAPAMPGADKILAAIEKLTGAVQASNIRALGSDGPKTETADDVLAQLLAPKKEDK